MPGRKAARQGDHNVAGEVVGGHIVPEPCAGHSLQGGLPAQDGPGQGVSLVDRRRQTLGAEILGVVLIHADLLQDDAALGLDVGLVKPGGKEHIAEDVGGPLQVAVQGAGVEAGALLRGVGVHLAADGVHLLRERRGGAPGGALEEHMLDKVGGAVLRRLLLAAAGGHIDAQGGGAHAGDLLGQNAHAVGQGQFFVHEDLLDMDGKGEAPCPAGQRLKRPGGQLCPPGLSITRYFTLRSRRRPAWP